MRQAHTPGPWAFCNDTLCQAHGNYLHLGKWTESPGLGKAAEANKRLIAASPAMLAALQATVAAYTESIHPGERFVLGTNLAPDWFKAARAAIAAATQE